MAVINGCAERREPLDSDANRKTLQVSIQTLHLCLADDRWPHMGARYIVSFERRTPVTRLEADGGGQEV